MSTMGTRFLIHLLRPVVDDSHCISHYLKEMLQFLVVRYYPTHSQLVALDPPLRECQFR